MADFFIIPFGWRNRNKTVGITIKIERIPSNQWKRDEKHFISLNADFGEGFVLIGITLQSTGKVMRAGDPEGN